MAVGARPNSEATLDSLVAELGGISISGGFWTDHVKVIEPDWGAEEMEPAWGLESYPTLLVWLDNLGQGAMGDTLGGELRNALSIWIVGIVKSERKIQRQILRLAEDVKRVVRLNPLRSYPGQTVENTTGANSEFGPGGCEFFFTKTPGGWTAAWFRSRWVLTYRSPTPKG